MRKKITATTDLQVCGGPQKVIGQRRGSLVPGYAAMAADEAREREAREWVEGLAGDGLRNPRRRSSKACP